MVPIHKFVTKGRKYVIFSEGIHIVPSYEHDKIIVPNFYKHGFGRPETVYDGHNMDAMLRIQQRIALILPQRETGVHVS